MHSRRAILFGLALKTAIACNVCALLVSAAGAPAGQTSEAAVASHFRSAQQAIRGGDINTGIKEYKTVLRLDPTLIEARVNLGLAYHMLGEYDLAVTELSRALHGQPKVLGANIILGVDYLKIGSPEKAIAPLTEALAIEPSNLQARRALGACYLAEGDYLKAGNEFHKIFFLEADKEEGWFDLGHDYLDMTRQLAARMAIAYTDTAWRHRLAGDSLRQRHLLNDAAGEYRRALTLEPAQPGLHSSLGFTLLQLADLHEAENEFRRELQMGSKSVDALLGLAEIHMANGDATGALESITKVWDISPQFLGQQGAFPSVQMKPEVLSELALELQKSPARPERSFLLWAAYKALGETDQAKEQQGVLQSQLTARGRGGAAGARGKSDQRACESRNYAACASELQSRKNLSPSDYLTLGKAWFALGQHEIAGDAFAAALARNPQNVEASYWLIRTYTALSETCFTQLMADFPDSWRAHQLRAEIFQIQQADKDAIEEYQAAARLRPDDFELHRGLGELYLSTDSFDEAGREIEKALTLNPGDARGLYLMGRWYVAQRQPQQAITYLQRALRYEPGLLEARAALGKAYLRTGQAALAAAELEKAVVLDRYGDVHYLLYEAYRDLGKKDLAKAALARSQELRRKSAADDQAKIKYATDSE